jgi:aspartate-semialdehyde dehydrogenase
MCRSLPEVNPDHLSLLKRQQRIEMEGGIVANPNCSTAGLMMALAPSTPRSGLAALRRDHAGSVRAGYPGVPSLDLLGNVIPFIEGEEEKIAAETCKILGDVVGSVLEPAAIGVSAHTNRVAVVDGHTEVVSAGFARRVKPAEALEVYRNFKTPAAVANLPSTPARPIEEDHRPDRPQPRLDVDRGNGMSVTIGRIRSCPLLDLRLVLLSHNTVRGAAGAAIQNAELLVAGGYVK